MNKILLFVFMLCLSLNSYSQSIIINNVSVASSAPGLDVSLNTTSFNGAGYLNHSYTITGNVINLKVCYWFNTTLPVLNFHHDFFIPMTFTQNNYTLVVEIHNSVSNTQCDYFSMTDIETLAFLSKDDFTLKNENLTLYPNPTNGIIHFKNDSSSIKKIHIYDNLGRLVKQFSSLSENNLNLNDLNNGLYIANIETEKGNYSQKIILKK